jgi:alkylation response protein AidB-like acyl-CoA dehydrogenase
LTHFIPSVDDPGKLLAFFETLAMNEQSATLKLIVQINLWGGTILFLGSEQHHKTYLEKINTGDILGLFGLTELGHGTNVRQLETMAVYDDEKDEFIINTPTWISQKFWPGGIASDAMFGVIFARLVYQGLDKGVHVFIVPIRPSPRAENYPGITTYHIPLKSSYNGVDNGGLLIHNIRIPRSNHLDKVTKSLEAPSNLAQVLEVFLPGRIAITSLAIGMAKTAITITTRHCFLRKQFSSSKAPGVEVPIIEHCLVQKKVMRSIARIVVSSLALRQCANLLKDQVEKKFLHVIASGFKAVVTWDLRAILITCRELLGGQGFILENRIGFLIPHLDMTTTGEGDNTMLMKQTIQAIINPSWMKFAKLSHRSKEVQFPSSVISVMTKWRNLAQLMRDELILMLKTSSVDNELDFGLEVATLYLRIFNMDSAVWFVNESSSRLSDQARESMFDLLAIEAHQVCHEFRYHLLRHNVMSSNDLENLRDVDRQRCSKNAPLSLNFVRSFGVPEVCLPRSNLLVEAPQNSKL